MSSGAATSLPGTTGDYPWVPDPGWAVLAPFWDGVREGVVRFPRCHACGRFQWYPQRMCPACQGMEFDWVDVPPNGTIYTHTTVRRAFIPEFSRMLPIVVALVDITGAPGVRLVTDVVDVDPGAVSIGAPVEIVPLQVHDSVWLPVARLVTP